MTKEKQQQEVSVQENEELILGKFASTEQLCEAYKNLEREFTKKCRQLNEMQPEKANDFQLKEAVVDNPTGPAARFQGEGWQQQVEEFLHAHPESSIFADAIAGFLVENPEQALAVNPLEKAYLSVLKKSYIPPEALMADPEFLEQYVFGSGEIRQKIILDYLTQLQQTQSPATIGDNGSISLTPPPKPRTIAEASALAEKYFKK